MTAVGGSIESVTIDGQLFAVASDADAQISLGGFTNEVKANGNGGARIVKTRVPFVVDGLTVEIDDSRNDHEFLQNRSDSKQFYPITVVLASGFVWQGNGILTGDMQRGTQETTMSINIQGAGKLTKQ